MDESGDAGMKLSAGSSRYFCMTAVIFEDQFSANACDRCLDELRRTLHFPARHEFHFSESSKKIRSAFFDAIRGERFNYHSFVVDKSKLAASAFRQPVDFYEFAVRIVCENARDLLSNSRVVIDHSGDRHFVRRLAQTIKSAILSESGAPLVREVKMEGSHSNNLVQLADMACGAVARSISGNDSIYRDALKKGGREKRVQVWPR
jgi:hypothetical protein